MYSSSEHTGTDFSAVKHQSHQPSSSIFSSEARDGILQISPDIFAVKQEGTSSLITLSPTLVDPALVSVIRAVDGQDTGLSVQPAEKKNLLQTGHDFLNRAHWSSLLCF